LKTLVSFLSHGQLDTASLGQRNVRLGALADDKDVSQTGGKSVAIGILKTKLSIKIGLNT
jgi:hypothetical protein